MLVQYTLPVTREAVTAWPLAQGNLPTADHVNNGFKIASNSVKNVLFICPRHDRRDEKMKSPHILRASACMSFAAMLAILTTAAPARTWTIHQRQLAEQSRITKGEKSGELTKKEADGLRE